MRAALVLLAGLLLACIIAFGWDILLAALSLLMPVGVS